MSFNSLPSPGGSSSRPDGVRPAEQGCFCVSVRLVFSKGELMTEGGWAGVKVAPASEEAYIAGEARYRYQPGNTVGSDHPKGGGRARPDPPIGTQSALFRWRTGPLFLILAMRKPGTVLRAVSGTA